MTTVLITSIGSISATGVALCLAAVRHELRIVATNSVAEAAGNFLADRAVIVPPTASGEDWLAAVQSLIDEERPLLVINGRDEEVALLARLRERNDQPGIHLLAPSPGLVPAVVDKYESYRFARHHDLPFAETASSAEEVAALMSLKGLPLVAKPRRGGFSSHGVCLVRTEAEVEAILATATHVFQEMLPCPLLDASIESWRGIRGIPWRFAMQSVDHEIDLLIDGDVLTLALSAGHADGSLNRDIRIVEEPGQRRVADAYGRVFARLGHCGPLNLQGRLLPDGRYIPFELNARFTGTMPGKAALGFNLVRAALSHWGGVTSAIPLAANDERVDRLPLFIAYGRSVAAGLAATGEWRKIDRP